MTVSGLGRPTLRSICLTFASFALLLALEDRERRPLQQVGFEAIQEERVEVFDASESTANTAVLDSAGADSLASVERDRVSGIDVKEEACTIVCYANPAFVKFRPVDVKFHPDIAPHLFVALVATVRSLKVACYVLDDYFATAFQQLLRRQVRVQVICDKPKLVNPTQGWRQRQL